MKNNNGVTMVSLVITIIILFILAGIGLQNSVGDNGILTESESIIDETNKLAIKKNTELLIRKYCEEYYDKKYKTEDFEYETEAKFVISNINENDLEEYIIKKDETNNRISVYSKNDLENIIVSGKISDDGIIKRD